MTAATLRALHTGLNSRMISRKGVETIFNSYGKLAANYPAIVIP
jgi:hypothetical protein